MSQLPSSISLTNQGQPILEVDNASATARISLFGGHVLSFIPKHDGRERLWLSEKAIWDGSKPIRGGTPVCWPWFGTYKEDGARKGDGSDSHSYPSHDYPSHGYVRTRMWSCLEAIDEDDATLIALTPFSSVGEGFSGQASVSLLIRVGSDLTIQLCTKNIGSEPFTYTNALHTYFNISDINQTELLGLSGDYADKPSNFAIMQTPILYAFSEETDRIHLNPVEKVAIQEPGAMTEIKSRGHDSIVVWNPWKELSESMADMPDDGYQNMLCVETAITQGMLLQPEESHLMEQIII